MTRWDATFSMPTIDIGADTNLLRELVTIWQARRHRNVTRSVYYDGEQALKDFGISLPPQMSHVEAVLGWSAKGVHAVTDRSNFEGFVDSTGSEDPFGLEQIMWENRFRIELPAAQVSSAVHGCSFLTVTSGDVQAGEPEVLVMARAAEMSAAKYDKRRRTLAGFLSITALADDGSITEAVFYTPTTVYLIARSRGMWQHTSARNPLGVVPVAPLVHKFELQRPLGHSRITRASMYAVDAATRAIVRAEVSAEFYSAPEYWLFGADVSQFAGNDRWTAVMGRIKALEFNPDDGDPEPKLHRFNGASPQPHTDQLRMWANLFADDQDLEVKFADSSNPSSADAIFAAKETLITTTRTANTLWSHGAVQAMQYAVMLRDGLTVVPDQMRSLRASYTDPAIVSPSARSDAYSKISAADPEFAKTRVGRKYAGLSHEEITQLEAEQRRGRSLALLEQPAAAADAGAEDAAALKAKFDALGVAIRAGVNPETAARRVGLDGIDFTGAVPVSLRLPEPAARDLEEK